MEIEMRISASIIERRWREANEEKRELIEEILDQVAPVDREILKCLFGIKEYSDIKRPSVRLTAKIVGISRKEVTKRVSNVFDFLRNYYRSKLIN